MSVDFQTISGVTIEGALRLKTGAYSKGAPLHIVIDSGSTQKVDLFFRLHDEFLNSRQSATRYHVPLPVSACPGLRAAQTKVAFCILIEK